MGIVNFDFDVIDQLPTRHLQSSDTAEKMGDQQDSTSAVYKLKKGCDSVGRKADCTIFFSFVSCITTLSVAAVYRTEW
jgi:hypothetical protein